MQLRRLRRPGRRGSGKHQYRHDQRRGDACSLHADIVPRSHDREPPSQIVYDLRSTRSREGGVRMKSRRLWFIGVLALAGAAFGVVRRWARTRASEPRTASSSTLSRSSKALRRRTRSARSCPAAWWLRRWTLRACSNRELPRRAPGGLRKPRAGARPRRRAARTSTRRAAARNIRVNQDCSLPAAGRGDDQVNPNDPSEHDRRPERLADRLQPLRVRLVASTAARPGATRFRRSTSTSMPDGHTADACSDPTATSTRRATPTPAACSSRSTTPPARSSSMKSNAGERRHVLPLAGGGAVPGVSRRPAPVSSPNDNDPTSPTTRSSSTRTRSRRARSTTTST